MFAIFQFSIVELFILGLSGLFCLAIGVEIALLLREAARKNQHHSEPGAAMPPKQ